MPDLLPHSGGEGWQTTTPLLPHQQDAVAKLLPTRVGALFAEMGTGKSRVVIELAKLRQTKIDRVLWFCPVSAKETISREIQKHTVGSSVYVFDQKTSEKNIGQAAWYVIGTESVSSSARVYLTANKLVDNRTMVIVDESHQIKGHKALRTKRLTALAAGARYRMVLTGTPLSQGAVDLFAQMRFLSPKILGYRSFWSFAERHLVYSTEFRGKIERTINTEYLAARINPYVYQITKEECLTLPEKLYTDEYCRLSDEQYVAYEDAKQEFFEDIEFDDSWERSIHIFRLFTRLQTIVCGFDGWHTFPHKRIDLLKMTLEQIPKDEPVVIWAKYHYCLQKIIENLQDDKTYQYHGRLSESQRQQQLDQWRKKGGYLVATQASGGASIDLTHAAHVVYYANGFKYSERQQSEDRCHRIGQKRRVVYTDLWADAGIDSRIQVSLATKQNVAESFRKEVQAIRTARHDVKRFIQSL